MYVPPIYEEAPDIVAPEAGDISFTEKLPEEEYVVTQIKKICPAFSRMVDVGVRDHVPEDVRVGELSCPII